MLLLKALEMGLTGPLLVEWCGGGCSLRCYDLARATAKRPLCHAEVDSDLPLSDSAMPLRLLFR